MRNRTRRVQKGEPKVRNQSRARYADQRPSFGCSADDFENGPINKLMMYQRREIRPRKGFMNERCCSTIPPDEVSTTAERQTLKFWNRYAKGVSRKQKEGRNDF